MSKRTRKGGYKSDGKYAKPHPYILIHSIVEKKCRDGCILIDTIFHILSTFTYIFSLFCLCTFWHAIPFCFFSFLVSASVLVCLTFSVISEVTKQYSIIDSGVATIFLEVVKEEALIQ